MAKKKHTVPVSAVEGAAVGVLVWTEHDAERDTFTGFLLGQHDAQSGNARNVAGQANETLAAGYAYGYDHPNEDRNEFARRLGGL